MHLLSQSSCLSFLSLVITFFTLPRHSLPFSAVLYLIELKWMVFFPVSFKMESNSAAKTKNDKAWRGVSDEIKKIFRAAVLQLQEKGTMKAPQAKKFLCSRTVHLLHLQINCLLLKCLFISIQTLLSPRGQISFAAKAHGRIRPYYCHY